MTKHSRRLKEKLYFNSLVAEKLVKLNKYDRQEIVKQLTINKSERQLAKELGIPRSTINDWVTLRQDNAKEKIHISLSNVYLKLKGLNPDKITDWGRIEQIRNICDELLKKKILLR